MHCNCNCAISGSNITYNWDFGDNSTLESTIPKVDHTFASRGCYNVSVIAENLLDMKMNYTTVCIQDAITNLQVRANSTSTVNVTSRFYLTADSGSDYVCTWDWDDGSPQENTTDVETPITWGSLAHTYTADTPVSGPLYDIQLSCANQISSDNHLLSHKAQWPIKNLQLDSYGAQTFSNFLVGFSIDQGTDPAFTLTFDGAAVATTYDSGTLTGSTSSTVRKDVTGMYEVAIQAQNDVSDVNAVFNFTVEIAITGATLVSDPADPELTTGNDVTFTVDCSAGSSVSVEWDFQDTPAFTNPGPLLQDWSGPQTQTHTFHRPGEWNVTVTLFNNINSISLYQTVIILSGIDNVTFVTDSPAPFIKKEGTVQFWFEVDGIPPAGADVRFDFTGDGTFTDPEPFAEGKIYSNTYTSSGMYTVTARVYNAIDQKDFPATVRVVVPVSNLMLYVDPPHAPIGYVVKVCVSMDKGENVSLSWDFADPMAPVITEPRLGEL